MACSDWNGQEIGLNTDGRIIAASPTTLAKDALSVINRGISVPKMKGAALVP